MRPVFAILLAATIGGFHGVLVKILNIPPESFTFFRVAVPFFFLLIYMWMKKEPIFSWNKNLIIASVLNAVRIFMYILAFYYTSVANAVIVLFSWPIFATIFAMAFLKERVSFRNLSLITIAFIGVIIMNYEGATGEDMFGMAIMMVSAIFYALTIVLFKKELKKHDKKKVILYQNMVGVLIFTPLFLMNPTVSLGVTVAASMNSFLVGVIAFMLFFYALGKMKVSHYSVFTYFEVIAAILFSFLLLGETIGANALVGGTLIIVSGLILRTDVKL